MTHFKFISLLVSILFCKTIFSQNATITIKNKSDRNINVRLMKGLEKKSVLYKTDSVAPKSTLVLNVYETGFYYTKLRAIQYDKKSPENSDTIYSKDRPIQIISDKKRGHSNVTIEFKVKESKENNSITITRKEFDN